MHAVTENVNRIEQQLSPATSPAVLLQVLRTLAAELAANAHQQHGCAMLQHAMSSTAHMEQ